MSEVKVTRQHRMAALECSGWRIYPECTGWAESGGDTHTLSDGQIWNFVEENAVAKALATAEHRVRAAVIADLKALLESAHTVEGSPVFNAEYVYADSIRNLIETLEAQQS